MRYLGGKSRLGKEIAYVINQIRKPGQAYWEPFCGSCWVTIHVHNVGPMYASDGCFELIEMWKALQNGWQPPRVVTEEMYQDAKAGKFDPALTAFIGFGCSHSGRLFGGYAISNRKDRINGYANGSRKELLRKLSSLYSVLFFFSDYRSPPPQSECLIYADPPYKNTEGYSGSSFEFDTSEFWQTVRSWVTVGHTTIISEYAAPDEFVCVREMETKTDLNTSNGKDPRIERLFMHESQAHLYRENVPEQLALI